MGCPVEIDFSREAHDEGFDPVCIFPHEALGKEVHLPGFVR